jgi:hypothetical protein
MVLAITCFYRPRIRTSSSLCEWTCHPVIRIVDACNVQSQYSNIHHAGRNWDPDFFSDKRCLSNVSLKAVCSRDPLPIGPWILMSARLHDPPESIQAQCPPPTFNPLNCAAVSLFDNHLARCANQAFSSFDFCDQVHAADASGKINCLNPCMDPHGRNGWLSGLYGTHTVKKRISYNFINLHRFWAQL